MDIFIRALQEQSTDRELSEFFRAHLAPLGNPAFLVNKLKNKSCAILTIANLPAAHKFLAHHGSIQGTRIKPLKSLVFQSRPIYCSAGKGEPDPFIVQGLQQQEKERHGRKHKDGQAQHKSDSAENRNHTFGVESVSCGAWEYKNDLLASHHIIMTSDTVQSSLTVKVLWSSCTRLVSIKNTTGSISAILRSR